MEKPPMKKWTYSESGSSMPIKILLPLNATLLSLPPRHKEVGFLQIYKTKN
jgi:hypothetical protein